MSWRVSGQFKGSDPDAIAYIAAVEQQDNQALEYGVNVAINNFVVGCKADGIWDAIKASCILAGARTLAGALVPLVGTAPTNFNFVSGDYDRKTGLVGNANTKYLDSNYNNNAGPQNSRHAAVYVSSAHTQTGAGSYVGAGRNNTGASNMGASSLAQNSFFSRLCCSTAKAHVLSRTHTGFAGMNRSSASEYAVLLSPSATTVVQASETPFNGNFFVFGENNSGTLSEPAGARLAFYSIGEALDLALLDTRTTRLTSEIQFAINTGLNPSSYDIDTLNYVNAGYAAGGTLA